jgi:hypothetical protein
MYPRVLYCVGLLCAHVSLDRLQARAATLERISFWSSRFEDAETLHKNPYGIFLGLFRASWNGWYHDVACKIELDALLHKFRAHTFRSLRASEDGTKSEICFEP